MKRIWFACQPVDEGFFEVAPVRLSARFEVPRSSAEVWAELTGERPLHWCRILQEVRWTSPRPLGVGATREANALHGLNMFRERYFHWEEGRRHSFHVVESTAPTFRRFAEDYLLEPTTDGGCRLTWTIAFEPKPLALPTVPLNRAVLKTLFTDTRDYFGLG